MIPPAGNGNNNRGKILRFPGVSKGLNKMITDPRIPKLARERQHYSPTQDFAIQTDYFKNVIARNIGEAKSFDDLGKLGIGWATELYDIKPEYADNIVAFLLKKANKLAVLASNREIDLPGLGLDKPQNVISWAMQNKATVYLVNILRPSPFTVQGKSYDDIVVVTLPKKSEAEIARRKESGRGAILDSYGDAEMHPLSESGMDVALLKEKIGNKAPSFVVAPLIFKDEVLGALFLAFGVADPFQAAVSQVVVASELASNLAFGIKYLQRKGLAF